MDRNKFFFTYFSACCLSILFWHNLSAQQYKKPPVISKLRQFQITAKDDEQRQMVSIAKLVPGIVFDFKYATADNFTSKVLYPSIKDSYLRKKAAMALASAQKDLAKLGLGLKIWDAYRPYSVTVQMWQAVPDERYAANPQNGSGHNRGTAVDVTLINITTGEELNMGTGFDNFSDTASVAFKHLPDSVISNREILISCMKKHGFLVLDTEWWHFYLPDSKNFELMDIPFNKLRLFLMRQARLNP